MTLKSYLRMLLAAVTLLFVTSGCNDDDDKVGPPPSYSFSVAVSDVAQTEATVTVTPSNDQATYYYAAVKGRVRHVRVRRGLCPAYSRQSESYRG